MTLKEMNDTITTINKLIEIEEEIGEHDILPARIMLDRLLKFGDDAKIAKIIKEKAEKRLKEITDIRGLFSSLYNN